MNKSNSILLNPIEFGCSYCGKNYKTRIYLNKHKILCETLNRAKNKINTTTTDFTDLEPIPSQTQMYKIILDLSLKCNRLEEKMNDMQKWMDRKKKKTNIIDLLRNNKLIPEQTFIKFQETIEIQPEEIELILHQSYLQVFQTILNRLFPHPKNDDSNLYPIYFHIDKPNTLFIYNEIYFETNKNQFNNRIWVEASKDQIMGFLKNVHFMFGKAFIQSKKNNEEKINNSDNLSDQYNKANIKLMGVNMKDDLIYQKQRTILLNKIKTTSIANLI